MGQRSVHVVITGGVQGVGYRAWAQRRARELDLSGWVRNRSTGEVEAVFSGAESNVESMLLACREGPHGARVRDVSVAGEAAPVSGPFEITDTV